MLENQIKQVLREANTTNTAAGGEEWAGIVLPLVRRVFANISAKEFISTQAMTLPNGLVFWLDHKYATGQAGFSTGQARTSQEDSIYGVTGARRGTAVGTGGLYGPGRFGYTINDVEATCDLATAASILSTKEVSLNYNSELLALLDADLTANRVVKITFNVTELTNPDLNGVRAFTFTSAKIKTHLAQYTSVSTDGTKIVAIVVMNTGQSLTAGTDTIVCHYHKQPTDITRGDFEEGKTGEDPLDIPSIDLQMRSETIVAKTRRLKAQWTQEFAQDIDAYHSIDTENEMTGLLGDYISQEVDAELLDMLIQNAQTRNYWSARIGFEYDSTDGSFAQTSANASAYNQGTWFQTIGTKIQRISNEIHRLTLRGEGANFIMTSPTIATILESIPGYAADTDGTKEQFAMGVSKVGMMSNRWTVYKNPYMTENIMLIGYRGGQYLEAGAAYCPYIPLLTTPLILDPDNFNPRKAIMTRYALSLIHISEPTRPY